MTDKEKILAEIERLKKWEPIAIPQEQRRKEIQCARMGVLIGLEDFINSLPTNQPSEDLKKAADCYLESIQPVGFMEGDYDGSQIIDAFKAGADLQKEKELNEEFGKKERMYNQKIEKLGLEVAGSAAKIKKYQETLVEISKIPGWVRKLFGVKLQNLTLS